MAIEINTIARPYAKAAFEFALAESSLQPWAEFLELAALITRDEQTQGLLSNPHFTPEMRTDFYCDVAGDKVSDSIRNFVHLLSIHNRLAVLPYIYKLFKEHKAEHEKTLEVHVTCFKPLSQKHSMAIMTKLSKRLGREIQLVTTIDEALIGGVIIRAGDLVIDGSVRGKIQKMREQLVA